MIENKISQKQIGINLITNFLAMGTGTLISLWITPYLINRLGVATYGYIGIIGNLISFMAVLTYTLTSMVGRFLTVSLNKDGPQAASRYMSSAFYTSIFMGALLLPIFIILTINLGGLIKIQSGIANDVKLSFFLEGLGFVLTVISLVISTGPYSRNRLDISNWINILSNIVRVGLLVMLYSLFTAHIWFYSIAAAGQVLIALILGAFTFRALLPDVQITNFKLFDFKLSWELLSSGFFNAIIILGNIFITQIDLLVGNRYLPAEVVGMYAAALLIPSSIRGIASALSYAFSPTTVMLFSTGKMVELRKYTNMVVKFCGLLIGWPSAIVSALAVPILGIWLRQDYSTYQYTFILMLLPLTVHLSVNQLYIVQQATNKVRIPAVAAIVIGIMNLALAIFFTSSLKMGIFGIVLSGILMSTVRTVIFYPIYTSIITNQPKLAYYRGIIPPLIVASFTCAIGVVIQKYVPTTTLFSLFGLAGVLSIIYLAISTGVMSIRERVAVQNLLGSFWERIYVKK